MTARTLAAILVFQAAIFAPLRFSGAQTPAATALNGHVSSKEEGSMEGVLVSAKRVGSTVTVTVVSDTRGRYSFPRTKLEPGQYSLRIRAAGYEIHDPGPVEVTAQKATQVDLKLFKTHDLASQLSNTEWFLSLPGTEQQKNVFSQCDMCHSLERVARSHLTASEFENFIPQMLGTYSLSSTPQHPVKRIISPPPSRMNRTISPRDMEYLSSINLSKASQWKYPLKALPRPSGKSTRVIITEYDLPRPNASPHDVMVGAKGMVWYSDFAEHIIGVLDTRTAKVTEYTVPQTKPGFETGINNLEVDGDGKVWMGLHHQSGVARFDPEKKEFQTWTLPKEFDNDTMQVAFLAPLSHGVDSKIWSGGGTNGQFRLDLQSGHWEPLDESRDIPKDSPVAARPHGIYGLTSDSKNNLYEFDIVSEYIVKVDSRTLKATYYRTPTMNSGPRRGHMDSQDRLWFAENRANTVAVFDTKTERFREWLLPTPFSYPYDAVGDKNDELWTGGMASDRVVRLNTRTDEIVEYLLPHVTNIRRVDVDNSTSPVTFWTGNRTGAAIIKIEPLE